YRWAARAPRLEPTEIATIAMRTVATGISHIQPEARNATSAPKRKETPARIQTGPATTCEPSQASFDLRTSGIRRPKYLFPGSRQAVAKPPKTSQYSAKINMIIPTATMTVILIPDRRKYPYSNCRKGSGVG